MTPELAAVAITLIGGALVAIISGTYLIVSGRGSRNGNGVRPLNMDIGSAVGNTPTEMWLQRFERIERGQLWTMAVLIGQGCAFLLFSLFVRQEAQVNAHKLNDRLDILQMAVSQDRERQRRTGR